MAGNGHLQYQHPKPETYTGHDAEQTCIHWHIPTSCFAFGWPSSDFLSSGFSLLSCKHSKHKTAQLLHMYLLHMLPLCATSSGVLSGT